MSKYKDLYAHPDPKPIKLQEALQDKRQLPDAEPHKRSPCSTNTTITLPPSSPKSKNYLKRAMLIYSRIHYKLRLRFETLFRAIAIAKAYKSSAPLQEDETPEEYVLAACMYLAMKYEEIYPPQLRKVMQLIKPSICIDRQLYFKAEVGVLLALGGNLDIPTPYTQIDAMFVRQEKTTYVYAYYLLELSLTSETLANMDYQDLCVGVIYAMTALGDFLKRRSGGPNEERIQECAKTIIKARYVAVQHESALYKKYSQECYLKVAETTVFVT